MLNLPDASAFACVALSAFCGVPVAIAADGSWFAILATGVASLALGLLCAAGANTFSYRLLDRPLGRRGEARRITALVVVCVAHVTAACILSAFAASSLAALLPYG